jgi:biopolymer transport protein ExbD
MAAALAGANYASARKLDLGQNHDINVTPFVDVMLVLLIVMMVAAPLATTSLKINLPRTGAGAASPPREAIVSIDAQGRIYVSTDRAQDAPAVLGALGAALAPAGPPDQLRVAVRADQGLAYGRFMRVVNELQTDGYYKLDLISEKTRG